jgi:ubiquinone/menaquinone biosynthesis C-methylase UbiE
MSILNYFSKDPNKRARFIFNFIAPLYSIIDRMLKKNFNAAGEIVKKELVLTDKTVLDLGCGTGAWGSLLKSKGAFSVSGIDLAENMVKSAKKKHPNISFTIGNIEALNEIADNSFDIVTTSFVMHGVKVDHRKKILQEMIRITKKNIIIHDFIGETPWTIAILEFLEKSDYKNFKVNFVSELEAFCSKVKLISAKKGSGVYLAEIPK